MLLDEQINKASKELKLGKIILLPTDTIWGISCDAFNKSAYEHLSKLKVRPMDHAFILLVASIKDLKKYVEIHPRVETLLTLHHKPLTIIYENHRNLPDHCIATDGTVAIRVANEPLCQQVIEKLGRPITTTSANIHGDTTPLHFGEIPSDIITGVDFVFNLKRSKEFSGLPSVIARPNKKGGLEFVRE